jgi:acyl carrier protein
VRTLLLALGRAAGSIGHNALVPAPTIDDIRASLTSLFPSATIDLDVPMGDLGIDSMDLLEWLYALVEDHGVEIDEEALQAVDDEMTIRQLYESVFST